MKKNVFKLLSIFLMLVWVYSFNNNCIFATKINGFSSICVEHEWKNGTCAICNYKHSNHTYTYKCNYNGTHTGTCECGVQKKSEKCNRSKLLVDKTTEQKHTYACLQCGSIQSTGHSYNVIADRNATHHIYKCVCGKTGGWVKHNFVEGKCKVCEYECTEHQWEDSEEGNNLSVCKVCKAEHTHYFPDGNDCPVENCEANIITPSYSVVGTLPKKAIYTMYGGGAVEWPHKSIGVDIVSFNYIPYADEECTEILEIEVEVENFTHGSPQVHKKKYDDLMSRVYRRKCEYKNRWIF